MTQHRRKLCRKDRVTVRALGPRIQAGPIQELGNGTTAAIGGAFDSPRIFRVMREATGRRTRPRIAVVLSSKDGIQAARKAYFKDEMKKDGKLDPSIKRWFFENGFEPVFIPLTIDNYKLFAHDRRLAGEIASCDAVYLAGGDQAKHVRCLLEADGSDTPVLKAIRSVVARGGLVSGSSAGAAAQGGLQYGGGDVYRYLVENRLIGHSITAGTLYNEEAPDIGSIQSGLGILRDDVLVCTHFDQRYRLARLLVALHSTRRPLKGIGVDEDTGLFVRGNEGRVVGSHGVFYIDPSEAKFGEGPHFEVEGVRLTYLTDGDRIDLETGVDQPSKRRTARAKGGVVTHDNILSDRAMTKLIEEMVRTGADRAIGFTKETDPQFTIELRTDRRSRTYDDGKRVSASQLILDVRKC